MFYRNNWFHFPHPHHHHMNHYNYNHPYGHYDPYYPPMSNPQQHGHWSYGPSYPQGQQSVQQHQNPQSQQNVQQQNQQQSQGYPSPMGLFTGPDGSFDFQKAINSFDQVMKTANQVSPIMKQIGSLFRPKN